MPTLYEPFDGDYIDANYGKLLNDLQDQNFELGAFLEICVSMTKHQEKIQVVCSNDEGSEWEYIYEFDIPTGWKLDQVREMLEGNVYMRTDDYVNTEQDYEEEE